MGEEFRFSEDFLLLVLTYGSLEKVNQTVFNRSLQHPLLLMRMHTQPFLPTPLPPPSSFFRLRFSLRSL